MKREPAPGSLSTHEPPAVRLDDLPRQPQADAEAAELPARHRAHEALEDALLIFGADAEAAILDGDDGAIAVGAHGDVHRPALAVAQRVRQRGS